MATPVDPLGPLRSPLRPEISRRSYRQERDTSGLRSRHTDRDWEGEEARGQIERNRNRRSWKNTRRPRCADSNTNGAFHHESIELKLDSAADWPIVGTVPNQNEEGCQPMGSGDREMRSHNDVDRFPRRCSVKERLGKRPTDNEVKRDLGNIRGRGHSGRGRRSLGHSAEGCRDQGHSAEGQSRNSEGKGHNTEGRGGQNRRSRRHGMDGKRKRESETAESCTAGDNETNSETVRRGNDTDSKTVRRRGRVTDWGSMMEQQEERDKEKELRSRSFSWGSSASSSGSQMTSASSRGSSVGGRGRVRGRGGRGRGGGVSADVPRETDEKVLARRQKQLEYGMNTAEYLEYRRLVPKSERTRFHPSTPDKDAVYSRRSFDTIVRIWRKSLHFWDPNNPSRHGAEGVGNNNMAVIKLNKKERVAADVLESPRKKCKQEQSADKYANLSSTDGVKQEMSIKQEPGLDENSSSCDTIKPSHLVKLKLDNDDDDGLDLDLDDFRDLDDYKDDYSDNDLDDSISVTQECMKTYSADCDDAVSIDISRVKPEKLSRTDGEKSPLKSVDMNAGGVHVNSGPTDQDFDMYEDL